MAGYGADLAAIHAAGFTALAEAAAAELIARLAPRSLVVELGCGDGTTARLLSDVGHDVHASDASPAFVALARRNAPVLARLRAAGLAGAAPPAADGFSARTLPRGYAGAPLPRALDGLPRPPAMSPATLTQRELNRALMERQGLLERARRRRRADRAARRACRRRCRRPRTSRSGRGSSASTRGS